MICPKKFDMAVKIKTTYKDWRECAQCEKEKCAWWMPQSNICSMLSIACMLEEIDKEVIQAIRNKI